GHQGAMRTDQGWVSSSYGALRPAPSCVFTARAPGPRDVVSFFVPRSGNQAAVEIHEQPAANGRAFVIGGSGAEDILLVGGGGEGDLLGADRIVVCGDSSSPLTVVGARRAASVGRGDASSGTPAPVEVS